MVSVLDRPISLAVALSVVLCVLLGSQISAFPFAPVAGLAGLALLPGLLSYVRRFRLMPSLLALLGLSVIAGLVLTGLREDTHTVSMQAAFARSIIVVSLMGGIAVVLFARVHIGTAATGIAYGVGMVISIALEPLSTVNPWRFSLSIPITVLILAVLAVWNRLTSQVIALLLLGVIGILNDARSNSAILFLAAVVLIWQRLARAVSNGRRHAGHVLGLALFAAGFVLLMQFSLLEGYFGEASQAKSEAQIATSGNLLLGGRPEAAASMALIARYPLGLGGGLLPTGADVTAAKTAMLAIGYDPDNGYVQNFMFGTGVEVHSVLGDFWLWFGLAGLAACLVMAATFVMNAEHHLRNATLTGLMAYLSLRFFWDLLFSPPTSGATLLALAVPLAALLLPRGAGREPADGWSPESDERIASAASR